MILRVNWILECLTDIPFFSNLSISFWSDVQLCYCLLQIVFLLTSRYCRTEDEVQAVLVTAKVSEKDLTPTTQVLSFSEPSEIEDNLFLLELDGGLLDILSHGERYLYPRPSASKWFCISLIVRLCPCSVVFRGEKDESAVMCTKNRTYEVKIAETSNSLALVPEILWSSDTNIASEDRTLSEKSVSYCLYL